MVLKVNNQKSLTVALIGEPNAGKSTLLNALVGEKVSIVTHKVQTTRHNIKGVVTEGETQIIFIDTPGLFDAKRTLEKAIVKSAKTSFEEADIVCLMFDVNKLKADLHKDILSFVKSTRKPLFAIINKTDLVTKDEILPLIQKLSDENIFQEIIPISAMNESHVERIKDFLKSHAQPGPWHYEDGEITDQSIRNICEEITREQAFILLHQEIPYSLKVETEMWEEEGELVTIHQALFVVKESQKAIALGKGGIKIKEIGKRARYHIGKLLDKKVRLFLYIKVREDWIERDFGSHV
ncbi:MAG: GTP-binding protein Era [Candidatus Midichloriaceae bacterium]|jgi:GTP-binding protein Era|nr:GTP-binding protein Era [Candidatus Midichloriaceae bacterium]